MSFLNSHKLIRKKNLESPKPKTKKTSIEYVLYDGTTQNMVISKIDPYHQPIFRFMKLHLTRKSETRAIMKDCVDLNNKIIIIKRNFSYNKLVKITKGRTDRIIPIADELMPEMERLYNKIPKLQNDYIFKNKCGTHYGDNILTKLWKGATEKLGIPYVPLHWGTRNSGATELLNMDYTLKDIQQLLGHADFKTTEKSYAHYANSKLIKVVNSRSVKLRGKDTKISVIRVAS